MPTSSIVSAISAAPWAFAIGITRSALSRPASRLIELTIARPGIASSAASITSGSVESIWIGAGWVSEMRWTTSRIWTSSSCALGQRDADVQDVRAAVHLVLGHLHESVVVVGEEQLLGLARALRVDALADERRARLLDEVRCGHHRAHQRRRLGRALAELVILDALGDRADVVGRRAAAAADDADAVALDELAEHLRDLLGRLREDRLAVRPLKRQSGVRDAVDRQRRGLAQVADGVAHVLGTGRAVEPDHVDVERVKRRQDGGDVRAEEHLPALGQERDRGLDRQGAPGRLECLARAEDRRLHLQDVLGRLDDDQVGAALDQAARLLFEDLDEPAEADVAQRRIVRGGQEARRADRARDEAVRPGGLARDLRRAAVDLERVLAQAPLLELQAGALERVGLDDLRARFEHRLVNRLDDVRAVEDQRLMALALEPAVVLGGEVELLQGRAHPAVEDDDALAGCGYEVTFGHLILDSLFSIAPGGSTLLAEHRVRVAAASSGRIPQPL